MPRRSQIRGFTLVESLLASVLLSLAVLAVSLQISSGHMQMYQAVHAQRATRLAEELTEYIVTLPYHDPDEPTNPGPEADELTVSSFDNADDYDGYSEPAGQVKDMAGQASPETYQLFSRSVTAQYVNQTANGLGGSIPGLLVTVTVQDEKGQTWPVTRFIPQPPG